MKVTGEKVQRDDRTDLAKNQGCWGCRNPGNADINYIRVHLQTVTFLVWTLHTYKHLNKRKIEPGHYPTQPSPSGPEECSRLKLATCFSVEKGI